MTGSSAEIGGVQITTCLIESNHSGFVQKPRGYSNQILSMLFEARVELERFIRDTICQWIELHANKHVSIAEPFDRLLDVRHASQTHFRV